MALDDKTTQYEPADCEYFPCKQCNNLYRRGAKTCPHCGAVINSEDRVMVAGRNGKPMWIPTSAVSAWQEGQSLSQEELDRRKADLLAKLKARTPSLQDHPPAPDYDRQRLEKEISALRKQNAALESKLQDYTNRIDIMYADSQHVEKIFVRIALILIALCVTCSFFFHNRGAKSGYAEGEAAGYDSGCSDGYACGYELGHEEGAADGYDRGYNAGYDTGTAASKWSDNAAFLFPGTNTNIASARDTAIADGYIGNVNSHKFHVSWCSYLPDQENQIVFSSREDAIAAGYDPCGRCYP